MDVQFDATADGRCPKFLNVIGEHSRLCLAIRIGRRRKASEVVAVLGELTGLYPAPRFIRSDNGPEFIAHPQRRWRKGNGTIMVAIALSSTVSEAQVLARRWPSQGISTLRSQLGVTSIPWRLQKARLLRVRSI